MGYYPWWGDWAWRAKVPMAPWLQALMWLIGFFVMIPTFIIITVIAWAVWWVFGVMCILTAIVIIASVVENCL